MDAHKEARRVFSEANVFLDNYCYCGDWEEERYLMFNVSEDSWQKIKGQTYRGEEFVFTVDKKPLDRRRKKESTVEIKLFYKPTDPDSLSSDITEDGCKKYGVISPEGKFYRCDYSGHNALEYWLKQRSLLPSDQDNPLEYYGWIKLTGSYMTECEFSYDETIDKYNFSTGETTVIKKNVLTQEQIDVMVSYIESLGREYINFNFHWYTLEDFKKITDYKDDIYAFDSKYSIFDLEDGQDELMKQRDE